MTYFNWPDDKCVIYDEYLEQLLVGKLDTT